MITFKPIDSINEIRNHFSNNFQLDTIPVKQLPSKEIKKDEFSKTSELGSGQLGTVYKGEWKGVAVAIKVFYAKTVEQYLMNEFDPYYKADNEHIIQFHGMCKVPGKLAMIMELADCNLKTYLERFPKGQSVPTVEKEIIELGVAKGLNHLHNMGYVCRSLCDTNVLLTADLIVKLSDFNFSKLRIHGVERDGMQRWSCPEMSTREFLNKGKTLESQIFLDIYSYGMILWQLESKKTFSDQSDHKVVQLLKMGNRPEFKNWPNWSKSRKELADQCLSLVPSSRPTTGRILEILEKRKVNGVFTTFLNRTSGNVFSQHGMKDIMPAMLEFLARV